MCRLWALGSKRIIKTKGGRSTLKTQKNAARGIGENFCHLKSFPGRLTGDGKDNRRSGLSMGNGRDGAVRSNFLKG
jgi:hypothetical protein